MSKAGTPREGVPSNSLRSALLTRANSCGAGGRAGDCRIIEDKAMESVYMPDAMLSVVNTVTTETLRYRYG
jgi:hypothetical protein